MKKFSDYPQNYAVKKTCEFCTYAGKWRTQNMVTGKVIEFTTCRHSLSRNYGTSMRKTDTCGRWTPVDTRTPSLFGEGQ